MKQGTMLEALKIIAEGQRELGGEHPVKLSVGAVDKNNFCRNDVIVIYDCSASTIDRLKKAGFLVDMSEEFGGLRIDSYVGE
jgi:hypothetical protein